MTTPVTNQQENRHSSAQLCPPPGQGHWALTLPHAAVPALIVKAGLCYQVSLMWTPSEPSLSQGHGFLLKNGVPCTPRTCTELGVVGAPWAFVPGCTRSGLDPWK